MTDDTWKVVTEKDGAQFLEIPVQAFIPQQDTLASRGLSSDFVVMDEAYETVDVVNNEGDVVRSEPVNPLTDESPWKLANPGLGRVPPTERAAKQISEMLDTITTILGVPQNPQPTIGGIPFVTSPAVPQGMFLTVSPPSGVTNFPIAFRNTPEPPPRGRFQNLDWDDE